MRPRKRYPLFASLAIFGITAVVWVHSFLTLNITVRSNEIALLGLIFVVPAGLVSAAVWVMLDARWWRILLGIALLVPGSVLWILSLLLTSAGFRIH